jgi:hypothetical protein
MMTHVRMRRVVPQESDTQATVGPGFSNGQAHSEPPAEAETPEVVTDSEATAIEEIRSIAGQLQASVVERVIDNGAPFEQQAHSLMLESIDRITQQWVSELVHFRNNSDAMEAMVIAQAAKVKHEITKLHLLGVQAMKEAKRGHEVLAKLADEMQAVVTEYTH